MRGSYGVGAVDARVTRQDLGSFVLHEDFPLEGS